MPPYATYVDATSGLIDTFHDRTGLPVTFAASGAGARATLVNNQLAGFACAHFEGSAAEYDDYVSTGLTLATGAAFTFAAILRLQDLAENHAITGRYASTTSRAVLQVTSGNLPRLRPKTSLRQVRSHWLQGSGSWLSDRSTGSTRPGSGIAV